MPFSLRDTALSKEMQKKAAERVAGWPELERRLKAANITPKGGLYMWWIKPSNPPLDVMFAALSLLSSSGLPATRSAASCCISFDNAVFLSEKGIFCG